MYNVLVQGQPINVYCSMEYIIWKYKHMASLTLKMKKVIQCKQLHAARFLFLEKILKL